ncbi:PREDICTED: uncharacterized protein LOC109361816 [Lupinus angustifolius]|uniref:uncharacterized protein LOC109361816 n=1 Tax=Lupinus angustifolius TaxID=3871 RepID=UPI00092F58A7|nr:PREDICTED: uncharacterized protein LOC109361816 [Lupinus angustifolius]
MSKRYAEEVLRRFGMLESNSVHNPTVPGMKIHGDAEVVPVDETYYKQIVGSLMYLTSTRPDLMYATSLLSMYMARPTELHLQIAKGVLRYLKGTICLEIFYKKSIQLKELEVYTDGDYAGDNEDRKSTSGYVFLFNSGVVAWSSKKQPIITLSTTEAEFVVATVCLSSYLDEEDTQSA